MDHLGIDPSNGLMTVSPRRDNLSFHGIKSKDDDEKRSVREFPKFPYKLTINLCFHFIHEVPPVVFVVSKIRSMFIRRRW